MLKDRLLCGPGSIVGIATGYRLDGLGGEIFCTCPDCPWSPPSLLYNGYRVFPGGKERPGRDADRYSPYGPYGLYRASVPVQECTLLTLPYRLWHLLCWMLWL